jgi:asparagine synthase (glutamine-hydrolysing)
MSARLAHRGPDGEGEWVRPGVALLHRRLSIIDLATGDQPMGNEDGSIQVVFNGEIYNFEELRRWLQSKGHQLRTRSDTEVIVHLYEEVGEELVTRLRGMFAFALWDQNRGRLLLGRDRLGIKPLYLFRDETKLVFASEPKAILAHPDIAAQVDITALEDYLTFGVTSGPQSIFRGIEKLPPAHLLVATAGRLTHAPRRYWNLQFEPDSDATAGQWMEQVRSKIEESVRGHLLADVPVGAFLSGGLDSSIVTLTAAALQPGLRTFSVGFDHQSFNELPYARMIADKYGTTHTEETVTADAVALLDELSYYYDEPFGDSSAVPTFLLSKVARQHVKVALSGDGGDEAFGGYARYAHDLEEAKLRAMLPAWFRQSVVSPIASAWPKADRLPRPLRAKTRLTNISRSGAGAYANTLAVCRNPMRRSLVAGDIRSKLNGYDPEARLRAAYGTAPADDPLAGMISADVSVVLPDDYLVKVDRASMANGLEVRPPLLDHELLELTARMPSRFKIAGGETKWLLKQCYADALPGELRRRPKQGFEMPVERWMAGPLQPLFESEVLKPGAAVAGLIDQQTAGTLLRDHVRGAARHGQLLWNLLVLAKWAERYVGAGAGSRVSR